MIIKKLKKKINNFYFKNINNLNNLKFALALSSILKLNKRKIYSVVNSFKGLNFRQQILYKDKNLTIINDSKSTSFSSSINLLQSHKNIYWLVGGKFKKGDKFKLSKKYYKNINAYIFGKNINFFINKFRNKLNYQRFKNIEQTLKKILYDIKKKNFYPVSIIFSPSAASFDQFKNFEERGNYFNSIIKKLRVINKINVRK